VCWEECLDLRRWINLNKEVFKICNFRLYIVRIYMCDSALFGFVNGFIGHLHNMKIQPITARPLMSTIHRSPQHMLSIFPAYSVFNSRSLATGSNGGDSSASRAHVVTVWRISRNWTLVNCHLNYSAISSQPPLQSSTQLSTLNRTHSATNYSISLHSTELPTRYWRPFHNDLLFF
jgi:hypothetical protein